jgi:hypothetical protein
VHALNDAWTVYVHDPGSAGWKYTRAARLLSVEDFWAAQAAVRPRLGDGSVFLMRGEVYPSWDDPPNVEGGCLSLKVPSAHAPPIWEHVAAHMVGETLVRDPRAWGAVNGASISPKRNFCVVKLWLRCDPQLLGGGGGLEPTYADLLRLPPQYGGEVIYRSNRESIGGLC